MIKTPISYTEIFQFRLHIPFAVLEDLTDRQLDQDCLNNGMFPLCYIRDKNHPVFKIITQDLKMQGITEEVKTVVLGIGYNNPYLS